MTLDEIKTAVDSGKTVLYVNPSSRVVRDVYGKYYIIGSNGYCIGLTWVDGKTVNGQPEDFYIDPTQPQPNVPGSNRVN